MLTQATRRPRGCSNQAASAQLAQLHATASSRRQRRQPPQAAARAPRRQRCHTRRGEHAGAHESTARNIMHTCTSHTTFDGEHGRFCATAVEEKQRCVFSAPLAASDLRHSWGPSWTELHRLVTWPPQAPPEPGRRRPVSANHRLFAWHRTVNLRGGGTASALYQQHVLFFKESKKWRTCLCNWGRRRREKWGFGGGAKYHIYDGRRTAWPPHRKASRRAQCTPAFLKCRVRREPEGTRRVNIAPGPERPITGACGVTRAALDYGASCTQPLLPSLTSLHELAAPPAIQRSRRRGWRGRRAGLQWWSQRRRSRGYARW